MLPGPGGASGANAGTLSAVIAYMLFSSTMLIINKAAVNYFKLPSLLLWIQMAVSAVLVWFLGQVRYLKVDGLEWSKIQAYSGVVVVFIFNLFTNAKAVYYVNVETIIVVQTLTSLAVAFGDFRLLGGAMPSRRIILSLLIIVAGSLLYVYAESSKSDEFSNAAVLWTFLYFTAKIIDVLYTKHIVDTVPMTSWGRSFYNNFLALFPVTIMIFSWDEQTSAQEMWVDSAWEEPHTIIFVVLSCLMGLGISISGLKCRELVSATSFSVIGNMNKILTVFINFFAWNKHASFLGLFYLSICIFGGAYYAKVRQEELDRGKLSR